MENVAKGRMVSEWLRKKLPVLLGWAGPGWGTGAHGWGTPALPVPGAQPWLPGPLPPIGAVTSQFVEFRRSRRLAGYHG